jgi:hypothetical protein
MSPPATAAGMPTTDAMNAVLTLPLSVWAARQPRDEPPGPPCERPLVLLRVGRPRVERADRLAADGEDHIHPEVGVVVEGRAPPVARLTGCGGRDAIAVALARKATPTARSV